MELNLWLVFLLVLTRITAFVATAPLLSNRGIPALTKIALGMGLAIVLTPFAGNPPLLELDTAVFVTLLIGEALMGLTLGIVANLIFTGIMVSGQMMDMSIGFAMSNLFDPASQIQSTLIGRFLNIVALMMLLAMDGHHSLILALGASFDLVPAAGIQMQLFPFEQIVKIFSGMFLLAFKMAAPVLAVIFVSEISLGLVARTVPQLNVFILGFPLKIGVGVLVLAITMPIMALVLGNMISQIEKDLITIIGSFR